MDACNSASGKARNASSPDARLMAIQRFGQPGRMPAARVGAPGGAGEAGVAEGPVRVEHQVSVERGRGPQEVRAKPTTSFVPADVPTPSDSKPVMEGRLHNDEGPPEGGPSRAGMGHPQEPGALTVSDTVPTFQPPWPSEIVYWNESLPEPPLSGV